MTRPPPHLGRATRQASALGVLYGVTLLWTAWPREASPLWAPSPRAWIEPALLLIAQVAAVAGLVALVFALRSVARSLARGTVSPSESRSGSFPVAPAIAAPLAAVVAPAACILLAARDASSPAGLALMCLGLPAVAWAGTRSQRHAPPGSGHDSHEDLDGQVSRLRGASLLVTAVGAGFFFVSGSLVVAAFLPWAMLREVPQHAAPEVGPLPGANTPSRSWEAAGGGGGAPSIPDPAVEARAGEAIHSLLYAGSPKGPGPREKTPVRSYRAWWEETLPTPLGLAPHQWASRLPVALAEGPVGAEDADFLTELAAHPANREFDLLEGARGADVAGERLEGLEAPVAVFEIPIPRYVELWNGVRGRLAGALWLAHRGEQAEAQRRVDTVLGLGALLSQDGPSALDALMGRRIAAEALQAAVALEASRAFPGVREGVDLHDDDAEPNDGQRAGAVPDITLRSRWLASHAAALEDPSVPRGIRFEAFAMVQSFRPCRSLSAVLWSPAPWDDAWSQSRRETLATRPSEATLTKVLAHGWLGTRTGVEGWGWLPRILAVALSDRPAVTHCAPLAATLLSRG
ncbi:MAG: hypothetical protein HKN73_04505 [Gemmatimonadetes bacterium]|nr:hypothetical protein [Gemmatimonadota bacterium]